MYQRKKSKVINLVILIAIKNKYIFENQILTNGIFFTRNEKFRHYWLPDTQLFKTLNICLAFPF